MCRRVTCRTCSRPTFAGCGQHVEQVLGDVPRAERCHCRENEKSAKKSAPDSASPRAWLEKLFPK